MVADLAEITCPPGKLDEIPTQLEEVPAGVLEVRVDVVKGNREQRGPVVAGKLYLQVVFNEIGDTIAELHEVAVDFQEIVTDLMNRRELDKRHSASERSVVDELQEIAAEVREVTAD